MCIRDTYTHTHAARRRSAAPHGDERGLRSAAERMRQLDISPDGRTYGQLIEARLSRGETTRASLTCRHALGRGVLPSEAALTSLLGRLNESAPDAALELCRELRVARGSTPIEALIMSFVNLTQFQFSSIGSYPDTNLVRC